MIQPNTNNIDPGLPVNGATVEDLAKELRDLKEVVKGLFLVSHDSQGSIRTSALSNVASNSVGASQIIDNSITGVKLADNSIITRHYTDNTISTSKLQANSITAAKIASGALETRHFNENTIPLNAFAGTLTSQYISGHLTDDSQRAVRNLNIANNAVTDRTVNDVSISKLTGGDVNSLLYKSSNGSWISATLAGALTYNATTNQFVANLNLKAAVIGQTVSVGNGGGVGTTDGWTIRPLAEINDPDSIISISSGSLSLNIGKYLIYLSAAACGVGRHQIKLASSTSDVIYGSTEYAAANHQSESAIIHLVEISEDGTLLTLLHYTQTSANADDLGKASAPTTIEPSQLDYFVLGYIVKIS